MRKYHRLIILFLSLLLPLQAAANSLLAAKQCHEVMVVDDRQTAVPMNHQSMNMDMNISSEMDCCPSTKHTSNSTTKSHTSSMQCCDHCQTSGHTFVYNLDAYAAVKTAVVPTLLPTPFVAAFDPAAVWRPPTHV